MTGLFDRYGIVHAEMCAPFALVIAHLYYPLDLLAFTAAWRILGAVLTWASSALTIAESFPFQIKSPSKE